MSQDAVHCGAFIVVMQSTGWRAQRWRRVDADAIPAVPVADLQTACGDLVWLVALLQAFRMAVQNILLLIAPSRRDRGF